MSSPLSRRNMVLLLGASPLLAQNPPPPGPQPAMSEQRMAKAANDVRETSGKLATATVPMNIEPAFRFVA